MIKDEIKLMNIGETIQYGEYKITAKDYYCFTVETETEIFKVETIKEVLEIIKN